MQEQYGKYVIKYEELCEKFVAYIDGVKEARSEKLSVLKKRLDALDKEAEVFIPIDIFRVDWRKLKIVNGKITSSTDDGRWAKWSDGSRQKLHSYDQAYVDNAENRAIADNLMFVQAEKDKLNEKFNDMVSKLVKP